MKILVVGDWHSKIHEETIFKALKFHNQNVFKFSWFQYFKISGNNKFKNFLPDFIIRFQNKYLFGPIIKKINNDLYKDVLDIAPDVILVYRGTHILHKTLLRIKNNNKKIILIGYNNDNPFSKSYSFLLWRHFIKCIPFYDIMLSYRKSDIPLYNKLNANRVFLLRSWFVPEKHFPKKLNKNEIIKYGCDIAFIGHFENDGRLSYLEEIEKLGWKLKIFGPGYEWNKPIKKSNILSHHAPVNLVWEEEYNNAINGAKVALCFFSKLNQDTYTRRCFEIPATKTVLVSEYSEDLANLFNDRKEIFLFSNKEEFIQIINSLMTNKNLLDKTSLGGYKRVYNDNHDIYSRVNELLKLIKKTIKEIKNAS